MASYQAELATLVTTLFAEKVNEETLKEIYEFSKEVALQSFKNGLNAPKKNAPRERSAPRSALDAGKLSPAQ